MLAVRYLLMAQGLSDHMLLQFHQVQGMFREISRLMYDQVEGETFQQHAMLTPEMMDFTISEPIVWTWIYYQRKTKGYALHKSAWWNLKALLLDQVLDEAGPNIPI